MEKRTDIIDGCVANLLCGTINVSPSFKYVGGRTELQCIIFFITKFTYSVVVLKRFLMQNAPSSKKSVRVKMLKGSLAPKSLKFKSAIVAWRKAVTSSYWMNRVHFIKGIRMIVYVIHHVQTSKTIWILGAQLFESLLNFILQRFLYNFILLFPFHSPVLKPYFHLFFSES